MHAGQERSMKGEMQEMKDAGKEGLWKGWILTRRFSGEDGFCVHGEIQEKRTLSNSIGFMEFSHEECFGTGSVLDPYCVAFWIWIQIKNTRSDPRTFFKYTITSNEHLSIDRCIKQSYSFFQSTIFNNSAVVIQ